MGSYVITALGSLGSTTAEAVHNMLKALLLPSSVCLKKYRDGLLVGTLFTQEENGGVIPTDLFICGLDDPEGTELATVIFGPRDSPGEITAELFRKAGMKVCGLCAQPLQRSYHTNRPGYLAANACMDGNSIPHEFTPRWGSVSWWPENTRHGAH